MKINWKRETWHSRPANDARTLAVESSLNYPGGYSDPEVEGFAHEDGQAAVHNPAIWGENTEPHAVHAFNSSHDTNASLIGHDFRHRVQTVLQWLRVAIPRARSTEQNALDDVEHVRDAQINDVKLRHQIEESGQGIPGKFAFLWIGLALLGLFFGELEILALSFEVFRLSDAPLFFGLKFSNPLHMAAVAAVTALLVLAHLTGHKLLLIAHDFGRRRKALSEEDKEKLPRPSGFDAAIAVASIIGAWLVLQALSAIRVEYLRTINISSQPGPFLWLQAGIFFAAVLLSYHLSHPFGRKWADNLRALKRTSSKQQTSEGRLSEETGEVNAGIDERDTLLAQAGHHHGVSEANVTRQNHLYPRRVILSQPEPTTERLFPETLPAPTHREFDELSKFLIGITALPTFDYLTTDAVIKRREEVREEVRQLADDLRGRNRSEAVEPTEDEDQRDEHVGSTSEESDPTEVPTPDGGLDHDPDDISRANGTGSKANSQ